MSGSTITHRHCGEPMLDVTTRADRGLGVRLWICAAGCGAQVEEPDGEPDPPPPLEPTDAPPGSPERIAVMAARVAAGRGVFLPGGDTGVPLPAHEQTRTARRCRGVRRRRAKWEARWWDPDSRRQVRLGLYDTEEEAAQAVAAMLESGGGDAG